MLAVPVVPDAAGCRAALAARWQARAGVLARPSWVGKVAPRELQPAAPVAVLPVVAPVERPAASREPADVLPVVVREPVG